MDPGNSRTVYVVQVDNHKDLSDAKRYGALRAVFSNPRKPYDTDRMIAKARRELNGWNAGDYLLMIGDPALCAVCMTVVAEKDDTVNVLSWDRMNFQYAPQRWDFQTQQPYDVEDFATADD